MEAMDFESDNEQCVRLKSRPLTPHSSMKSRANQSDLSDMDVDPSSPASSRSSTSLEHINQAFSSGLSLKNVNNDSDNYVYHEDVKRVLSFTSTTSQKPENLPSKCYDLKKTWQPASLTASKARSSFLVNKTNYSQAPDVIVSNSVRQRQHVEKRVSEAKQDHLNSDSSPDDIKKHMDNQAHAKLEDSVPPKSSYKRRSSCLVVMSILILLFLVTVYSEMFYTKKKCKISRHFNKQVLKIELEANVFGQHLATKIVPDKIEEYFNRFDHSSSSQDVSAKTSENVQMCKPLVLSFDGWTGVGKNYISKFISEAFEYSTVMSYVVPYNFPHKSFEDMYRLQIQEWILGNFSQCKVNIIVVDEADKGFPTVIEGLTESIRELTQPCSSTSPTIFLLLSNTHGSDINRIFMTFLLDSPTRKREEISQDHFSSVFSSELNDWTSKLTGTQLIDAFVPFLPLEKEHVIQCIKKDLVSKRFSTDTGTVNRVLEELSFSSFGEIHISQTGCKRVADKVDLVMFEK